MNPSRVYFFIGVALALALCATLGQAAATGAGRLTCDNVRCGYGAVCQMKGNKPVCKCPSTACITIYQPVCGSDGKTYSNDCTLTQASCKSNGAIFKVKEGECQASSAKSSDDSNLESADQMEGSESNVKPTIVEKPADATTTNNNNDNKSTETNKSNESSPSKQRSSEQAVDSDYEDIAEDDQAKKSTKEPVSVSQPESVQSSDSETNESDKQNCKSTPEPKQTSSEPHQQEDQHEQPKADCEGPCTKIYKPVCGSNGVTYGNECTLKNAACKEPVTKVSDGVCKSEQQQSEQQQQQQQSGNNNQLPPSSPRDPNLVSKCRYVCVRAHMPRCNQQQIQVGATRSCLAPHFVRMISRCGCPVRQPPLVLHTAQPPKQPHQPIGLPAQQQCPSVCPQIFKPVCGSNKRTYSNECFLKIAACRSPVPIRKIFDGACPAFRSSAREMTLPGDPDTSPAEGDF